MRRLAILFLAALPLAACMGGGGDPDNPEYQLGYHDGCDSGITYEPRFSKRVTRNEELWRVSENYRTGWKSGFNHCRPPTSPGGSADIPGSDRY
jgi:hypothetical protein